MFPDTCIKPFLYFLKEYYKDKHQLVGAEIGVYLGHNSYNICEQLSMKQLYLIDPYINMEDIERKAHKRMKKHDDKITWIKDLSENCHQTIPNNLDFIYIDGNHDYEFVKKDIELYYPRIRRSGIICGDDFNCSYLGVVRAVNEFVRGYHVQLQGSEHDWIVIKE